MSSLTNSMKTGKCHVCGTEGHYARQCKKRKSDFRSCHICGETGHFARNCKDKKSDPVKVVHKETISLLVFNEDRELTKARTRGWYLASRCTVHVCNSRDMFVDYQPVNGHQVILENNKPADVVGFGTVMIPLTTGKVLTLTNVFHMPTITKCLISVRKLLDIGLSVSFEDEGCDIFKGGKIYGNGYNENIGLFRLSVLEQKSGVKVVHDETIGFLTLDEDAELPKVRARVWYLSSRCTVHVCNSRDMFVDYHPLSGHEVILDNNDHAEVAGVGTVVLRFTTGKVLTLKTVLHIPKGSKCVVSLSKLDEIGFSVSSGGGECVIEKSDDGFIGKGYVEDELIRLSVVDAGGIQ